MVLNLTTAVLALHNLPRYPPNEDKQNKLPSLPLPPKASLATSSVPGDEVVPLSTPASSRNNNATTGSSNGHPSKSDRPSLSLPIRSSGTSTYSRRKFPTIGQYPKRAPGEPSKILQRRAGHTPSDHPFKSPTSPASGIASVPGNVKKILIDYPPAPPPRRRPKLPPGEPSKILQRHPGHTPSDHPSKSPTSPASGTASVPGHVKKILIDHPPTPPPRRRQKLPPGEPSKILQRRAGHTPSDHPSKSPASPASGVASVPGHIQKLLIDFSTAPPPPQALSAPLGRFQNTSVEELGQPSAVSLNGAFKNETTGFVYKPSPFALTDEYYYSRNPIKETPKISASLSRVRKMSGSLLKILKSGENKK